MGNDETPRAGMAGQAGQREAREALVRQVLASRTFAKSPRLSQFFEFVCRKTIEGHSDEINEQQIGIHVFGRSPAYSATDDSIVRTQARLLRQRLEEYFEHECTACAMVVLIPKGGYVPVFEQRRELRGEGGSLPVAAPLPSAATASSASSAASSSSAETFRESAVSRAGEGALNRVSIPGQVAWHAVAGQAAETKGSRFGTRLGKWFWVLAVMLLVVGLVLLFLHPLRLTGNNQKTLWGTIFGSGRPVVIVPSDDGLVLSEELRRAPVTLDEYLSGTYLREPSAKAGESDDSVKSLDGRVTAAWLSSHQYTSTADLGLAMRLNRLPEAATASVETKYARVLRLEELKNRNVILIGGIGANPWVGLFSPLLNFDVNYDWKTEQGYVVNKKPKAGEQPRYLEQKAERLGDTGASSYGVLAYLPGVSGNGSALLFEGSGMAGTEAASDFPFSGEAFSNFLEKLGPGPNGGVPYFEVLLETRSLGGDAPGPRVVAWRVIPQ